MRQRLVFWTKRGCCVRFLSKIVLLFRKSCIFATKSIKLYNMNIRLTISNLYARTAMLLLVTVISIGGAWAQYPIDLSCATIKCDEGDFSKLLKGENSHTIHYSIIFNDEKLVELGEEDEGKEIYAQYKVEIKYKNPDGDYVPFTEEELRNIKNGHTLTITPQKDYSLFNYALTINPTDYSYNSQTVYFSVVRFEGDSPFIVSDSKNGLNLNLLAECVKNGITFEGESFKLGKDLNYEDIEYIPIGGYYNEEKSFKGSFDGCGHTIKGVNINSSTDDIGLFGLIGNGGEVKNLTLDNSNITGYRFVGGIVGYNQGGTITNCHVTSSVAVTVTANPPDQNNPERLGGIVGNNGSNGTISYGTVSYCSSAATLSSAKQNIGGIAGYNEPDCTLSHNLAVGAIVPTTTDNTSYGAITGYNGTNNTIDHNYYTDCGSSLKGCAGKDINENSTYGAYPLATTPGVTTIILYDSGSKANENTTTISQNIGKHNVVLAGRTLYKDGDWNTLCLPFDVTINGSVLSGADARTLSTTDFDSTTGTLTLDFIPSPEEAGSVTSLTAGTPYIIKWSNGENLVNPVFTDVTIASFVQEGTAADFLNRHPVETNYAKFIGTYSPTGIYTSPAVNLYLGANNTLYYPSAAKNINAFRAYFQLLNGLTAGDPESGLHVRAFSLNFDDDPTGIITTDYMDDMDKDGAWYSLDGRKYSAKPTAKGLYINKGKKVVIK